MTRIGHRMSAIANFVAQNPGCSMLDAALGTNRSRYRTHMAGYSAAHRAIDAGLIESRDEGQPRGQYRLYVAQ